MGTLNVKKPRAPAAPPSLPDAFAAQLAGFERAETERKLREGSGRRSAFLFDAPPKKMPRMAYPGGRAPGSLPNLGG